MGVVVDTCPRLTQPPLPTLTINNQGAENFIDRGGLHAETPQAAPATLKSALRGLTSLILIVLGTVVIFRAGFRVGLFRFLEASSWDLAAYIVASPVTM